MGLRVIYTHFPGIHMQIPDALSRAHLGPEHRVRAANIVADNALVPVPVPKYATNYVNYM